MLLDDLYQAIEKLRERMEDHQDKLKQSEALTRNALVDPLLRALGWDTEDPVQVMPEHRMDNNLIADYALLSNGKTAIVVEAKSLNTSVDDTRPNGIVDKGIRYCMRDGIEYYVTTDGRKWNIYETHRTVPIADKKIVSFDIADSPANVCLDALALWRRSVQGGAVRKAQTPLLEPENAAPLAVPVPQPEATPVPVATTPIATTAPAHEGNWKTLTQFEPVKRSKPPPQIRFPDGSTTEIRYWGNIPAEVVRWLAHQGKLDETSIPVQSGKRYILSGSPVHPNGADFIADMKAGQFYLEGNYSSSYHVKNATIIIEKAGIEVTPEQFSVRLPD